MRHRYMAIELVPNLTFGAEVSSVEKLLVLNIDGPYHRVPMSYVDYSESILKDKALRTPKCSRGNLEREPNYDHDNERFLSNDYYQMPQVTEIGQFLVFKAARSHHKLKFSTFDKKVRINERNNILRNLLHSHGGFERR